MASLRSLKREAIKSAEFLGHKMGRWSDNPDLTSAVSICTICGASVYVETDPAPNSIDVGGSAVAIGCRDDLFV